MYKLGVKETKSNNNVRWFFFDEFNINKTMGCYNTREEAINDMLNLPIEIDIPASKLDYKIF